MPAHQLPASFLADLKAQFPADFSSQKSDDLATYGKDWTKIYKPSPSIIAFPQSTDEVSRLLRLCSQYKVPVVPSGGRTGLSGGAVAIQGELVLSLSRMNKIGSVDPLALTVTVEAGAITEAVHQHCLPHHLTWPVDFASKGSSQVGGNIATNAGGVKVVRYGNTRNWVLGVKAVTMDGSILEFNGALEKNNTGPDLRHLMIGSEGILAVITEATLKLTRIPDALEVFFFAVKDIPAVLELFQEVRKTSFELMAFECLTQNCLEAVQEIRGLRSPFKEKHGAYVLLEIERPGSDDAASVLEKWLGDLLQRNLIEDGTWAQSPREGQELWSLRESVSESLGHKGFVYKNDIALPVARLKDFIAELDQVKASRSGGGVCEVFLFGHIGDGNLHVNTMKPVSMNEAQFVKFCKEADQDLFALIKKHHGSISAEHGIGLLKKDFLGFSRSAVEIDLLKKLKRVFDPAGLLNPGKVFD